MYSIALLGSPGAAKSTCGLSGPGVEQHVYGSREETTALNFSSRNDILIPFKNDWYSCLTDAEKARFTDDNVTEIELGPLMTLARARSIRKYRQYLFKLRNEMATGKPLKRRNVKGEDVEFPCVPKADGSPAYPGFTIFLDNGTPFADDFQDYVRIIYAKDFETKEGNFNSIAFSIKYKSELADFFRMMTELPCNVVVSFHINMALDQADAAKANFMKDTQQNVRYNKEWQPMIMGQAKYIIAGIFDYAFYLWCEESPGQANKYLAKLEADDSTVGLSKSRLQPFVNPRRIVFPKNQMFNFFDSAFKRCVESGTLQPSEATQGGR